MRASSERLMSSPIFYRSATHQAPYGFGGSDGVAALIPPHKAGVRGDQDDCAECDPVPGERREVVTAHVTQQPPHAKESGHERSGEADAKRRQIGGGEEVPVF